MSAMSPQFLARHAPHIAALFPAGVSAFEAQGPYPADTLFDAERVSIAHAVGSRVHEFVAGRACARKALAQLGIPPMPIPAGPDRAPIWPAGFTGSISHTQGYCVAVAAKMQKEHGIRALGVDVEQTGKVGAELWPQIMREAEIDRLCSLGETERAVSATLIFSAKEAFYKAQYALTQSWVDFDDAEVEILQDSFVLQVKNEALPIAHHARRFEGRFLVCDGHIITALAL